MEIGIIIIIIAVIIIVIIIISIRATHLCIQLDLNRQKISFIPFIWTTAV